MAKTRGTGLLMLWTDVDPQHEAEFNRWYDGRINPKLGPKLGPSLGAAGT